MPTADSRRSPFGQHLAFGRVACAPKGGRRRLADQPARVLHGFGAAQWIAGAVSVKQAA
jgi:hypothetical protein